MNTTANTSAGAGEWVEFVSEQQLDRVLDVFFRYALSEPRLTGVERRAALERMCESLEGGFTYPVAVRLVDEYLVPIVDETREAWRRLGGEVSVA